MLNKLKPKSEFSRNVLTLLSGTIIAQAIPIGISPILTRLYSPEEFGLFALYMGIASILAVIVTGRYEQAIMLPENDEDAANLLVLIFIIISVISVVMFLFISTFSGTIATLIEKPEIENWLYFLPVSVIFTGLYQALYYWNNRKKKYKVLSHSRILQSSTMSGVHVLGGVFSASGFFLIAGDAIGKFLSVLMLTYQTIKSNKPLIKSINFNQQATLARRYKKFPSYDMGAALANISSYQLQSILFPIMYGLTSAGLFFLVMRTLQAPLSLIGSSLTDVYKQKLTAKETTPADLKRYYKQMLYFLSAIGIIPLILFEWMAEDLFVFVFGEPWREAGSYAIILAPMFYIRFIASPLSYFLYLKEKQEMNIIGQLLLFISALCSIYFSNNMLESVYYISFSFSLIYLLYILYAMALSGNTKNGHH